MKYLIVRKRDLRVLRSYESGEPKTSVHWKHTWSEPNAVMIPVDDSVDAEWSTVTSEEVDGEVVYDVQMDEAAKTAALAAEIQAGRDEKLKKLRTLRNEKLTEWDNVVRDLALGMRSDQIPIREYRQSLKDITNDYKYVNDSSKGKASLDAFADDMSDFNWPTKP